jgi:Fur family ferric uptake transcriptional regulator
MDVPHSALAKILKEKGYRPTPQRLWVLEALATSEGHLSAEEVHARVTERYPYMDLSTVYRILDLLIELNLAKESDLGEGKKLYELASGGDHHHLVCRRCGKVLHLEDSLLEPARRAAQELYGFQVQFAELVIFGLCLECISRGDETCTYPMDT